MRLKLPDLAKAKHSATSPAVVFDDFIQPYSRTVRIRRNAPAAKPNTASPIVGTEALRTATAAADADAPAPLPRRLQEAIDAGQPEYRENDMQIQMLSRSLYRQIFGAAHPTNSALDAGTAQRFRQSLIAHGIQPGQSARLPDIGAERLRLPPLRSRNLMTHFERIAREQSQPYRQLADTLAAIRDPPAPPAVWRLQAGWTHYCPRTGLATAVPYPTDTALVFDIENCVAEGAAPTLACALGPSGWYSWTSESLVALRSRAGRAYRLSDMIPMESPAGNTDTDTSAGGSRQPRLIVGHNVSYDRARIKEQYWPHSTATRFLDTMSLHVCCSGVTSYQRSMLRARRAMPAADQHWASLGALNGLRDVHRLYWPEERPLSKELRNVFVEGTLAEIREDFQRLMGYCAGDVLATQRVLQRVWPMFVERFPHEATLAGMLELGMAYLPVTDGWSRYVQAAHLSFDDLNIEARRILERRANRACRLATGERWRRDVWLWDEDWSVQRLKMKALTPKQKREMEGSSSVDGVPEGREPPAFEDEFDRLSTKFAPLHRWSSLLPVRRPLLPGYPAWYRGLCEKRGTRPGVWQPGPVKIGTGMQVTPKLLSLCWEGYPLHYVREHGWGFMVPFRSTSALADAHEELHDGKDDDTSAATHKPTVPVAELIGKCSLIECSTMQQRSSADASEDAFSQLVEQVELNLSASLYWSSDRFGGQQSKDKTSSPDAYHGTGVWCDHMLTPSVWFFKLPHKDGADQRVGNPMAKDFLSKFSDNVLSGRGRDAERVIRIAGQLSYWRNNRDRIGGQTVVWLDERRTRGAIVPQVVVCGTLTRRASEPTWMTASNAQRERVGSELRGMVQAPDGYRFVGADVDSQELWIAAVLGDAATTATGGCHGATPFGWMTLNGAKSDGTDMHSVTAKAVGISRDHAKVINYARIYGAGQKFAHRLLKQFNPTITEAEAAQKAKRMFALTKGRRWYHLLPEFVRAPGGASAGGARAAIDGDGDDDSDSGVFYEDRPYTLYEANRLAAVHNCSVDEMFGLPRWAGGTESAMFNRLEQIAGEREPRTPFLRGRLTRPLEPAPDGAEDRFLPTRVNWVVQSGAVDFLHLMLVCMRWLMGGDGRVRFSLSFHDEVRYLVREEDAARAAVAMHVTNLLVRAFCVQRLGMSDLPQSVAFFQAVEIDRVLRKESQADYTTPSNPHGLQAGYGIPAGRSVGIEEALRGIAGDEDMSRWPWHRAK